jgi:hypothetical protein
MPANCLESLVIDKFPQLTREFELSQEAGRDDRVIAFKGSYGSQLGATFLWFP